MSDASTDVRRFYTQRVPAQWNRTLEAQEEAAKSDEAAARLLAAMRTVNATIGVEVGGDDALCLSLNIEAGRMTAADEATNQPFMTLLHDSDSFETLERESGDSVLGFLGAVAGLKDDMKLTSGRIQTLHGLNGTLRFELRGEKPMVLTAHFGSDPMPEEASCSISIDGQAYAELRSGELQPQDAFMSGQIEVQGDMQMAMQLALAAMSPE
jgi:hypothetical protein